MPKKYLWPFIVASSFALFHGLLSSYLLRQSFLANWHGQSNDDLAYSIPYAILNIPTLFTHIQGTTPLLIFGIILGIFVIVFRKKQSTLLPVWKTISLWLFLMFSLAFPIFLAIRATQLSPAFCEAAEDPRCFKQLAIDEQDPHYCQYIGEDDPTLLSCRTLLAGIAEGFTTEQECASLNLTRNQEICKKALHVNR